MVAGGEWEQPACRRAPHVAGPMASPPVELPVESSPPVEFDGQVGLEEPHVPEWPATHGAGSRAPLGLEADVATRRAACQPTGGKESIRCGMAVPPELVPDSVAEPAAGSLEVGAKKQVVAWA